MWICQGWPPQAHEECGAGEHVGGLGQPVAVTQEAVDRLRAKSPSLRVTDDEAEMEQNLVAKRLPRKGIGQEFLFKIGRVPKNTKSLFVQWFPRGQLPNSLYLKKETAIPTPN